MVRHRSLKSVCTGSIPVLPAKINKDMKLQELFEKIKPIKATNVKIKKGLTRDEAMKAAPWKKSYGDVRGFSYNPRTGIATWI